MERIKNSLFSGLFQWNMYESLDESYCKKNWYAKVLYAISVAHDFLFYFFLEENLNKTKHTFAKYLAYTFYHSEKRSFWRLHFFSKDNKKCWQHFEHIR